MTIFLVGVLPKCQRSGTRSKSIVYSILHISDLHRSSDEPVNNDSLIAALLADLDRYIGETPAVPSPDAIVVSGDLIQGVGIGGADWENGMRAQYQVAGDFLDKLARRFLNGDRSKLILIPGNHDVCWNTSFNSMEKVPEIEYPKDIRKALLDPESNYRWSWKERQLYRVRDPALYERRLSEFWDFAEKFYSGVPLIKPIDRDRGYQLFELAGGRIVVSAFDSTSGNDCFSYSGAISSGTVARCSLDLRDIKRYYDLRIAVWHHSLQGPPLREDYMDVQQIYEMIGFGFKLGLHGHQHVAAVSTHYVHFDESQAMAVVSAGSLCAGAPELPRGVNRQYNIVVIDDAFLSARVHVRELVEGGQFSRKQNGAFSQGHVRLEWKATLDAGGRRVDTQAQIEREAILAAEQAILKHDPKAAIQLLRGERIAGNPHARMILIRAALEIENWSLLASFLDPPQTVEESVYLVTALTRLNAYERATQILEGNLKIDPNTRKELSEQIAIRKRIKTK